MENRRKIIKGFTGILGVAAFAAYSLGVAARAESIDTNTVYTTSTITAGINDNYDSLAETNERIYGIGSVSKVYVTTAVMQLVDQGKLNLDTPITEYISGFTMADDRYKDITVRMLMNHTSGIMGSSFRNSFLYDDNDMYHHNNILHSLSTQRLKADPGRYAAYCNDGFTLLELIVEEVSGLSFTDYVDKNISARIGAKHTGTPLNIFRDPLQTETIPYNNIPIDFNYCMCLGSGGINSTATEVARFGSTFFAGDNTLLSEESKNEMNTRWNDTDMYLEGYGLGWDTVETWSCEGEDVKVVSNGGSISLQYAWLSVVPDKDISVAVLSKGGEASTNTILANALIEVILEDMGNPVRKSTEREISFVDIIPEEFKSYEGYYNMYSNAGNEIVYLSFAEDTMLEKHLYLNNKLDYFKLTEDGSFERVDEDGELSLEHQTLYFEEIDGRVYVKADATYEYVGLGSEDYNLYCGERLDANQISDDASLGWLQLNNEKVVIYNQKYSSEDYDTPFYVITSDDDMMGYISFGAPGTFGDLLKIEDEKKAVSFLTIESDATRDQYDLTLGQETIQNGREVFYIYSTDGSKYCFVSELPTLDNSVKTVDLYTEEASWFKIGDDIAGGTLSVERPEKSNIYVYNKYNEMVYSTHMHIDNDIPLPAGGYILFLGGTGETVKIK